MKSNLQESLSQVMQLANQALSISDPTGAEFLEASETYLAALEEWRKDFAAVEGAELDAPTVKDPVLRSKITELQVLHRSLTEKAKVGKDNVQHEMGDVHKRTQVLKTYVDILPNRISVAGKREG